MSGAREPSDTLLLSLHCAASARSALRSLFLPISKFAATGTSENSFIMTRYMRRWWGVGYEVKGVNTTHRWRASDALVIYKISLTRKWYMSGARESSDTLLLSLHCAASAHSTFLSLFLPISKFAAIGTSENSFVMTRYMRRWWGVGYEMEGVNTTHRWRASDAPVIYKISLTRKWYMSGAREHSDTLFLSLHCAANARSALRSLFLPISKFTATGTSENFFVITRCLRRW